MIEELTVKVLKEMLKDQDDEKLVLVDIGYPPADTPSWHISRNAHPVYGVDTDYIDNAILLEL